jgi:hypothetical protein
MTALPHIPQFQKEITGKKKQMKQAGIEILISEKADFKLTLIKQDKEGHSILIKGEIHQKEIAIINLYAPKPMHSISSNIL